MSTSPKVTPPAMNFPEALGTLMGGGKITKLEWSNSLLYGLLHDGKLQLHKPDGKYYDWIISDGDLFGKDWIVVKSN